MQKQWGTADYLKSLTRITPVAGGSNAIHYPPKSGLMNSTRSFGETVVVLYCLGKTNRLLCSTISAGSFSWKCSIRKASVAIDNAEMPDTGRRQIV